MQIPGSRSTNPYERRLDRTLPEPSPTAEVEKAVDSLAVHRDPSLPDAAAKQEVVRSRPMVAWVRPSEMPTLIGASWVRRGIDLHSLSIDSVAVPSMWAEAETQAGDELLPGTTAFTIHGTRHRSGIWEGEPVASAHEAAFTVFIVCGPLYPECHLLRLSMLDKPLG